MWFVTDFARVALERKAIEELEKTTDWLVGTNWSCNGELYVDAIIRVHGHDYFVRMTYPNIFPSTPPTVYPSDPKEHWSSHQYTSGCLCLEWGPDNWHQDVTGANMLESTYNLLSIENPLGEKRGHITIPAPSRHQLSLSQEMRGELTRLYVGNNLATYLNQLPTKASGILKFSIHLRTHTWLGLIHELQPMEGSVWQDKAIPKFFNSTKYRNRAEFGVFFKTDLATEIVKDISKVQQLEDIIHQSGYELKLTESGQEQNTTEAKQTSGVLIIDRSNDCHLFTIAGDFALRFNPIRSDASDGISRRPEHYQGLSGKSVGIIGLGSVGSKIALTLARMGVSRFTLIDHDIFFPENIERHILDWSSVAEHKVYAVEEMLHRINASIDTTVFNLHLTSQESVAAVNGALQRLGQCDLLVDATADAKVFNLMTAVATGYKKPLIWMEVYAGGVGGFIARSRPKFDPEPQTMRAIYNQYCAEHPAPEITSSRNYMAETPEGKVFQASDADVSVIADHAARFAIDTLLGAIPSAFPNSMYLIGLMQWWVFKAPFHTIPIATDEYKQKELGSKTLSQSESDGRAFIIDILQSVIKESNATSTTS